MIKALAIVSQEQMNRPACPNGPAPIFCHIIVVGNRGLLGGVTSPRWLGLVGCGPACTCRSLADETWEGDRSNSCCAASPRLRWRFCLCRPDEGASDTLAKDPLLESSSRTDTLRSNSSTSL